MRIVTYNLRNGGAKKHRHWSKIIETLDPDLFFAQETRDPSYHLPADFYRVNRGRLLWNAVPGYRWGSALFIKSGKIEPLSLDLFPGWIVGAEVTVPEIGQLGPLRILNLHAPTLKQSTYVKVIHAVLDKLAPLRGEGQWVIGGDFNLKTASRHSSQFSDAVRKAEMKVIERLVGEFGVVSAWDAMNPGQPHAQTLRWGRNGSPYHCDGIFIPQTWAEQLKECRVISAPEWVAMSDHYPVSVRLDWT